MRERLLNTPVIVVVGKIGSGKSTVLNNLFGLRLETKSSPKSVTKDVSEHPVEKDRESFIVYDTPGLGGVTRSSDSIMKQVASVVEAGVEGKDFTLLYCLPVKPSDTLTETDTNIMKSIDSHLGRRAWDKCVLLLTFSDIARKEFSSEEEIRRYTSYLNGHVGAFYGQFANCGIDLPPIKTVFEYHRPAVEYQQESTGQIVAIPVKKTAGDGSDILPGLDMRDWTEEAFSEISKTTRLKKRKEPRNLKDLIRKNPLRSTTGTLLGAGIGALIGAFSSPWGVVLGFFIGAAIGMVLAICSVLLGKYRRSRRNQFI